MACIIGVARDGRTGQPLARVSVELAGTPHRTVTGNDGTFRLEGIPPGDYLLQAHTVGYRLELAPCHLTAGEALQLEILLVPATLAHRDTVDVRGGVFEPVRADAPSELTLEGDEMKNLASVLADDPLRAVQAMPGVASNDDFNSYFAVRGADAHRLGIYLDGVLLHAPFHTIVADRASGSLTALQGDLAEIIALYPGAFSPKFDDRSGAALDVRTRQGSQKAVSFRLNASMSNAGFLAEGPLGQARRGTWIATVRKSYAQYIIERTLEDDSLAFGFTDTQGNVSYRLSPKHTARLSWIAGHTGLDHTGNRETLGLNTIMRGGTGLAVAYLQSSYAASPSTWLENTLAFTRESFWDRNRQEQMLCRGVYREWSYRGTLSWSPHPAYTGELGWSLRRLADEGWWNRYEVGLASVTRWEDWNGVGLRSGGHTIHSFHGLQGRLRISTGLRWDHHDANRLGVVSPYVSIAVQPVRRTELRAGWGQYTQYPEIRQFYSLAGHRWLLPERSTQLTVSLQHTLSAFARLRIEAYHRADRDFLFRPWLEPRILGGRVFVPPAIAEITNSLRGSGRGVEFMLQARNPNGLTGWISYAYGHSRLREGVTGLEFPADTDQRHTFHVYASYRLRPTVNLSLKYLYGSGFPIPGFLRRDGNRYYLSEQRNRLRLDPYHRCDLRLNKAFAFDRWKLTLFFEVVNLFNHRNLRSDTLTRYDIRTTRAYPRFDQLFPILPSVGIMIDWQP